MKYIRTIKNSNWKKPLGFRNLQEKLEKDEYLYKMALKSLNSWKFLAHIFHWEKRKLLSGAGYTTLKRF